MHREFTKEERESSSIFLLLLFIDIIYLHAVHQITYFLKGRNTTYLKIAITQIAQMYFDFNKIDRNMFIYYLNYFKGNQVQ